MLDDTRILDLSVFLPGSYASLLLAELGAEVIKVERPPEGEVTRTWEPSLEGTGYRFLQRNRGKKSICLDLKSDKGFEAFRKLAESADVIIEGFRPGTVDRLGIGYKDIRRLNPHIVYCSISGYGQDGPNSEAPGHDINYQSIAGIPGTTREDGEPTLPGVPIGDLSGGMFAALSITAALSENKESRGQYIDVSITDVLLSWLISHAGEYFGSGEEYDHRDLVTSGHYPCYSIYEAADGEHVAVGAVEFEFWETFCETIGCPELIEKHLAETGREERRTRVQEQIRTRTVSEWMELFDNHDVPVTPVHSVGEAINSAQAEARGMVGTVKFENEEMTQIRSPFCFSEYDVDEKESPPRLGEDNRSVLDDIDYSEREIEAMIEEYIIR